MPSYICGLAETGGGRCDGKGEVWRLTAGVETALLLEWLPLLLLPPLEAASASASGVAGRRW